VRTKTAARLAWALWALSLFLAAGGLLLAVERSLGDLVENGLLVLIFLATATVGALVASRQPGNAVGWLFLAVALSIIVAFSFDEYRRYALVRHPGSLPGGDWVAWLGGWGWLGAIGLSFTFVFLLFPDGRLPSGRWRPFAWLAGAFLAFAGAVFAFGTRSVSSGVPNPLHVPVLRPLVQVMDGLIGFGMFIGIGLVSVASLFLRYRRAGGEERRKIKWFAYAAGVFAASWLLQFVLEALGIRTDALSDFLLPGVAFLSLPVGAGIAILRHRLYDIDVVINKTVLFGLLAAFVTAVYVGIVVGIGALVGSRGNLLLSIVATAFIAVLFQPIRERARHLANRLIYGKRATPYELLSEFAGRLGGAYSIDDVLPRMARVVGEGTGAAQARVWLRVGDELRPAAGWPADSGGPKSVPLAGNDLPDLPGEELPFAVRHQGDLLGALSVATRPGESLTTSQEKLLSDLAAQAGLILRNVRLIEELRASRQRIVSAQDEERRRIERNIHDGAQQQLVALSIQLRLAESQASKSAPELANLLEELRARSTGALEDLRDLARGIYPPLLADKGLPAAVEAQAGKSGLPVQVETDSVGRYPQEAEAALYFCVLEALQNVAKYADASRVRIRLWTRDGDLGFEVEDDGVGFNRAVTPKGSGLHNMADRLEALGGNLEVVSLPGRGTTVTGRVPVGTAEAAS
jgi:signal transduction histidine kinase